MPSSFQEAYEFLLKALREHGLDWVTLQVQEEVRSGKPVTKEVGPFEQHLTPDLLEGTAPRQRGSRGNRQRLETTEDYSPQERLELAISALEAAIVQISEIENFLLNHLGKEGEEITIRFEPDELDEVQGFALEGVSSQRAMAINELRQLASELRKEINNSGD